MAGKKATGGDGLTTKQEAFALAFWETGNAGEAYRRAYDVAPDAKDNWIYVEACQLLDNPKIAIRLKGLREQAERLCIFNRDKALAEYEEARQLALTGENPSASAAVAATNGKVKLLGLEAAAKTKLVGPGPNGEHLVETTNVSETEVARRIAMVFREAMEKTK